MDPIMERIDHTTVNVTDLTRARQFYDSLLGLEEVPRPKSFDFPGAWYRVGQSTIHLVVVPKPDPETTAHFALWASNIKAFAEKCSAAGHEIRWSKHKIENVNRFFLKDPDGNLVEFQGKD